jgi:hypothetical protein
MTVGLYGWLAVMRPALGFGKGKRVGDDGVSTEFFAISINFDCFQSGCTAETRVR